MMDRLDQSDNDIDLVLQSFASASPSAGMEERVLHKLSRAAVTSRSSRFVAVAALVMTAACLLITATAWILKQHHPPVSLFPLEQTPAIAMNQPIATIHARSRKAVPHSLPNAAPKPRLTWASAEATGRERSESGEQNIDDPMNAPSQQAPVLPLTRQERLLLAAAHGQTTSPQIAALHRPIWPLRSPADDEDLRGFFDSPTPPNTNGENE